MDENKPPRRWYQYRLRTLFLAMILFAVVLIPVVVYLRFRAEMIRWGEEAVREADKRSRDFQEQQRQYFKAHGLPPPPE